MAAGPFRLSVIIGATTTEAVSALHGLEVRLNRISSQGGIRGGLAGGLSTGIAGLRTGVSALGSSLALVTMAFPALGTVARFAFSAIMLPLKLLTHAIGAGLSLAVGVGKAALMGLGAVAGMTVAGVYAVVKALGPAAFREKSLVSWEVMLGSPKKAEQRLGFLQKFEAKTPFNFREVDQGARLMQTFGIYTQRNLRVVGDAVSAFGKRIEDAVGPLAKLKNGLFESESLGTIGVTRKSLMREGVQFNRQGTMLTPGPVAFEAALRSLERRFGGMMDRIAQTWDGLMSTLSSAWDNLWATLGENPLGPAKSILTEIIGSVDDMAKRFKGFTIPGLDSAVVAARTLRSLIGDLFDKNERTRLGGLALGAVKSIPGYLFGTPAPKGALDKQGKPIPEGERTGGLLQAIAGGLGAAFGALIENLHGIVTLAGNVFMGVWRFGVALLAEVWGGLSNELRDKIKSVYSGEERQAQQDNRLAAIDDVAAAYAKIVRSDTTMAPEKREAAATGILGIASDVRRANLDKKGFAAAISGDWGSPALQEAGFAPETMIADVERNFRLRQKWDAPGVEKLGSSQTESAALAGTLSRGTAELAAIATKIAGAGWNKAKELAPETPAPVTAVKNEIVVRYQEAGAQIQDERETAAAAAARTALGNKLAERPWASLADALKQGLGQRLTLNVQSQLQDLFDGVSTEQLSALFKREPEWASRLAEALNGSLNPSLVIREAIETPRPAAPPPAPASGVPASAGSPPPEWGTPSPNPPSAKTRPQDLAAPLGDIAGSLEDTSGSLGSAAGSLDKLARREREAQSIRQDPERWLRGEGVGERDLPRWLALGRDRLADTFQQTGKRGPALFDAAGGKRFGFRLPENFDSLAAATPRERDRTRHDAKLDSRLTGKLGLLEAGKPVAFTPAEKRRLTDAGGTLPKPAWQLEQERLRPGLPAQEAPERLRPGLPVSRLDLDANRISTLGYDLAERRGPRAHSRVDMQPDAPQQTLFDKILEQMRRQNQGTETIISFLGNLAHMTGVA